MAICAIAGCPVVVDKGHCPEHTKQRDRARRVDRVLTYSESWWRRWREQFIGMLLSAGIVPQCGARLSSAPQGYQTLCQRDGLQTFDSDDRTSLHVHHEPELTEQEASDRSAVCDASRVILACARCHSVRTGTGG